MFSVPYVCFQSAVLSAVLLFRVLLQSSKFHVEYVPYKVSCLITDSVRILYNTATLSELDAATAKWFTGSVDRDGNKKRREELKARDDRNNSGRLSPQQVI